MFWVLLHRVTLLTKHWNYITKTIPFSSNTVVLSVSDNEEDHGVARDDDDDKLFLLSWLPVLMEFYLLPDRLRDTKLTPRPRLGGRLWDRIGIFQLTIQLFSFSSGNLKTQEPCAGNPMPYHWTIGPSATRMSLKSVLDTATCFILNKNKAFAFWSPCPECSVVWPADSLLRSILSAQGRINAFTTGVPHCFA
jgi:hypothetical protein